MAGGLITDYLSQGLAADRPTTPDAATGTLSLYFSTDTEDLSFYDWNDGAWQSVGSGALALDDLTDVDAAAPTDGDVLTWNNTAGAWEPAAPTVGATELDDLTDVDAAAPSDGDYLKWDAGDMCR
ncbi:hypothetical protein NT2_01_04630 [Caenibius tardaugens NBRC 16725]|uniref:Uncharacterized protein n=1 Tax=Caenibius tardaugens NBRC 16725 TaxID=1219035 RepID=U2YHP3_9SPHN|nr:hypothetical protein [Caenibius tardaugens]AZI37078.1 hypothetical protein EGO55_14830 [Caenibius tardaugens NBRC 16725]GAD47690.1 hypothetical protein NT2_01_04630 [Caenibius tardaugens NBRC 16725]